MAAVMAITAAAGASAGLPSKSGATTLTVLQDIYADFDYMQSNIDGIRALDLAKQYVAEAEQYLVTAQDGVLEAEQACLDAEANVKDAEQLYQELLADTEETERELEEARNRRIELTNQALAYQRAVEDYLPVWYEAQGDLQQIVDTKEAAEINNPYSNGESGSYATRDAQRAAWIEAAWKEAGYAPNMLPVIEAKFNGGSLGGEDDGAAQAYWDYLADLDAQEEEARNYFDSVSDTLDEMKGELESIEQTEADCVQEIMELEVQLTQNREMVRQSLLELEQSRVDSVDAQKYKEEALADEATAQQDVEQSKYSLLHIDDGMGLQESFEYYNWQGGQNRTGHQLYQENSFYWSKNHYDFSLSNAYVVSNTGLENGDMTGLTDTTLSAMYNNKHPVYDVRYGFAFNLPTGESRTYDNAIIPDHMARISRLSEGWNITPQLEVTKHLDKYTEWTWRTAYSLRGSYEDRMDDPTSALHPGYLWTNEAEYLHTDETLQYMGKFQYSFNGESSLTGQNPYNFTEGDGMVARGYYRKWFAPKDSWGGYMAWVYDQATASDTDYSTGSGIRRWYYGAGWFHQFDEKRQLRLFGNWMRTDGAAYDPMTRQSYRSGRRFSVSLGYDWRLDEKNSLSLDVERSVLRQQGDANYRGWGIALSYTRSF